MYVFCVTSHLAALYSHCQYLSFLLDWKYIFLPISTISKSSSVARNTWLTAPTTASQLRNLLFLQQTHEFTGANWFGILISIHPHPIFGDFLVKNCAFYKNCADCCDIDAKIVLCIVSKSTHSVPECGFEGLKTYPAPAHIWDLPRWWKSLLLVYKIFHMRTCGLSHQIMGSMTVKVAKTGFLRKIVNLQLEVP